MCSVPMTLQHKQYILVCTRAFKPGVIELYKNNLSNLLFREASSKNMLLGRCLCFVLVSFLLFLSLNLWTIVSTEWLGKSNSTDAAERVGRSSWLAAVTLEVERRQKHEIVNTVHNLRIKTFFLTKNCQEIMTMFFKRSISNMLIFVYVLDWSKKCFVLVFQATVQIQEKDISYPGIVALFPKKTELACVGSHH